MKKHFFFNLTEKVNLTLLRRNC